MSRDIPIPPSAARPPDARAWPKTGGIIAAAAGRRLVVRFEGVRRKNRRAKVKGALRTDRPLPRFRMSNKGHGTQQGSRMLNHISLRYLFPMGLISLLMAGCLSPITITPLPPKPAGATITSTTISATSVGTATLMLSGQETEEPVTSQCPLTPYASEPPASESIASFTPTWFRNEESTLWAGLAPPYEGEWYAGP